MIKYRVLQRFDSDFNCLAAQHSICAATLRQTIPRGGSFPESLVDQAEVAWRIGRRAVMIGSYDTEYTVNVEYLK